MSSGLKSFYFSVLFHLAIVIIVSLLITSDSSVGTSSFKNVITLNMGSLGGNIGGSAKSNEAKGVKSLRQSPSSSSTISGSARSNTEISNTRETLLSESGGNGFGVGSGDGTGSGVPSGNGNGNSFSGSVLSFKEPVYPKLALRRGLEGTLKMRITISLEGLPIKTEIIQSSGHQILDTSALESVSEWRFQKKSQVYSVEKTVVFKIKD